MARDEMLALLALADEYAASHPGQSFDAEQVLDWAVACGRIPPFANRLARAMAAETMREGLQQGRVRIDGDGTVSEPGVRAFEGLAPGQPTPRPRGTVR